ncbi:MAG: class I SAM-dependent methyltransferase [Bacteroidia bacterium]|nr:class I SAM-dependent methyltransferase [Bacteroidia bacterium]
MKKLSLANATKAILQPQLALKYLRLNRESKKYDELLVKGFFQNESVYQGYLTEIQESGLIQGLEKKLTDHKKHLSGELRGYKVDTGAMNLYQGIKLYALIRHLKPDLLVETGVCNGASTSYILKALDMNKKGKLYSIDFPEYLGRDSGVWDGKGSSVLLEHEYSGWLVPEELRTRWELRLGKSQEELPKLLEELGAIDFFMHDSEHSYECMTFEFEATYPAIKEGGILASHDIDDNTSFQDFCARLKREWLPVDATMGFFVK